MKLLKRSRAQFPGNAERMENRLLDGKTDVKSLMAKFNTGTNPTEEVSVNSRPFKVAGQNAPSGIQARKNLFDNQGNASPPAGPSNTPKFGTSKPPLAAKPTYEDKSDKDPKPPFLKPSGVNQRFGTQPTSVSRDPEVKAGFLKPVSPKPTNLTKEDPKPAFLRPSGNKLHNLNQESDLKTPGPKPGPTPPIPENDLKPGFSKVAGAKSKFMPATQDADSKPRFPRHTFGQKPSLSTEDSQEEESTSKNVAVQKGSPVPLGAKGKGGPFKPGREDTEDKDNGPSSSPFAGVVLKPAASRGSPGLARNLEEKKEERKTDVTKNIFLSKINQEEPARFPKAPSKVTAGTPWGQSQERDKGDKNSATPKQKPLPPLSVLGLPPPKPSRPPNVDLTRFRKADTANSELFLIARNCGLLPAESVAASRRHFRARNVA
ncbi:FYN binding protein [Cricetulus griseus]